VAPAAPGTPAYERIRPNRHKAVARRWALRTVYHDSEGTLSGVTQRRKWGRAFAGAVMLATAGAVLFAQSTARGSLSGKLTDLHSKPLDGATLVLRNAATGSEARTISAKNGSYRFIGLEPGEYSLEAANPELGHGQLRGIFISAGHEARIQAAVELELSPLGSLAQKGSDGNLVPPPATPPAAVIAAQASVVSPPAPDLPKPTAEKPSTVSSTWEGRLDLEPGGILTLAAASPAEPTLKVRPPETAAASTLGSAPERAAVPQRLPESVQHPEAEVSLLALGIPVASPASIHAADLPDLSSSLSSSLAAVTVKPPALRGVGIGFAVAAACAVQGTAQLQLALPPLGLIASHMIEPESIAPAARLSGEQLQALPLQGRHWENFVLDTPVGRGGQGEDTPDTPQKSGRTPVSVTVDGASTRLAFGGRGGGTTRSSSLMGPGRNESAIGEVRTLEAGGEAGDSRNANLETRGGSIGLHGQGFLFDRQNFLGAQNPFTQWVKETAPATVTSIPVFTPLPYTAPDSEYIWGVGIGSRIPRRRVFWFAAFDGTHRDYPGVTMVKHPDNFFAQALERRDAGAERTAGPARRKPGGRRPRSIFGDAGNAERSARSCASNCGSVGWIQPSRLAGGRTP
jgi:hypothetical protein